MFFYILGFTIYDLRSHDLGQFQNHKIWILEQIIDTKWFRNVTISLQNGISRPFRIHFVTISWHEMVQKRYYIPSEWHFPLPIIDKPMTFHSTNVFYVFLMWTVVLLGISCLTVVDSSFYTQNTKSLVFYVLQQDSRNTRTIDSRKFYNIKYQIPPPP